MIDWMAYTGSPGHNKMFRQIHCQAGDNEKSAYLRQRPRRADEGDICELSQDYHYPEPIEPLP